MQKQKQNQSNGFEAGPGRTSFESEQLHTEIVLVG